MNRDLVLNFMKKNNGQITRTDAEKIEVDPRNLIYMEQNGEIEKVERGVYVKKDVLEDEIFNMQYRFKKGVYFKDTSLYLHNMTDRTPFSYQMNFPTGYNSPGLKEFDISVYRQKMELYEVGIEEVFSPGGHIVKTYNEERTLCDILRKKDMSDIEIIKKAFSIYAKKKNKNYKKLGEYTSLFKIDPLVLNFMDLIL